MAAAFMTVIIDVINDSSSIDLPGATQLQAWGDTALKYLTVHDKPFAWRVFSTLRFFKRSYQRCEWFSNLNK